MDEHISTPIPADVEPDQPRQTPDRPADWDRWRELLDAEDRLLLEEAGYGHGV